MNEELIAIALYAFLAKPTQKGEAKRHFILLQGFDDATYACFLAYLDKRHNRLGQSPVIVRTTTPIDKYEHYALEEGKGATWYRNHAQADSPLILILNGNTSEDQSLQDIYQVNQTILATKGLHDLFKTIFRDYSLLPDDVKRLEEFLSNFRQAVGEPQLGNLVDFLKSVNDLLAHGQANSIQDAIALSLPFLELFRYKELKKARNEKATLKEMYRAARLGIEALDKRRRDMFLDRLERTEFNDDELSGLEKKALLQRFLDETIAERSKRIPIFELDWREVKNVLSEKTRSGRTDQLKALATDIESALQQQELTLLELPDYVRDVLQDMQNGKNADNQYVSKLLGEYQGFFGKKLSNSLRRLLKAKTRNYSDFILAVTTLAIELLNPLPAEEKTDITLHVTFSPESLDKVEEKGREAIAAFQVLYGSLNTIIPSVSWELDRLWKLVEHKNEDERPTLFDIDELDASNQPEQQKDKKEGELKEGKVQLGFKVTVRNAHSGEVCSAVEFNWLYSLDSPAATTLANFQAESKRCKQAPSIPLYNTYVAAEDMRDLDLQRLRYAFGVWYEKPNNLRSTLAEQLKGRVSPISWSKVEKALEELEQAWGDFIEAAYSKGILGSDLERVLEAYDHLLVVAADNWTGADSARRGYHVLTQAWVVSPEQQPSSNQWVMVPFVHPLKLLWWRERARYLNSHIASLLNPATQTFLVDDIVFRHELSSLYGSAGFPAILAQPARRELPEYFLPVEELEGYELYHLSSSPKPNTGTDTEKEEELEDEEAETRRAAEAIANVIQDYIETYPFIRDGIEIVLFQCRNAALPEFLVTYLIQLAERREWTIALSLVISTEDRGAPLFRRVSNWISANEKWSERREGTYFPSVSLRVLECREDELFQRIGSRRMDIVILADLLEEKGQKIEPDWSDDDLEDTAYSGYLSTYHAQQEPFEREENNRTVLLNYPPFPPLVRRFYDMQYAAQKRGPTKADRFALFRKVFGLQDWERTFKRLHENFNWVVCYDTTIDRYLLESTFRETVQVIRYSLGLGVKRQHNLTVSSSNRAQDVVIRRLNARLEDIFAELPDRRKVAERLVNEAKRVSGDIVLRAAGPGLYLNELIGVVIAKHLTEQRYKASHPDALTTWIYLDDFQHWFSRGKYPDLLFIAIPVENTEQLVLHIEVIETKCVGELSFESEARDAQRQTVQGVNRLVSVWMPGAHHWDADYWYDQLYRAVVGNISVEPAQKLQWEAFHACLLSRPPVRGNFELDLSGHSWVFCHDKPLPSRRMVEEGKFTIPAVDMESVLTFHHYGKAGLYQELRNLTKEWNSESSLPPEQQEEEEEEAGTTNNEQDTQPLQAVMKPEKLPETPLAGNNTSVNNVDRLWLQEKAHELERVLRQLGFQVHPVDVSLADVGPSVCRFKVRPYFGEPLRKLQRRAEDLARELALTATPIIDNIPGTQYVGIDLPRPKPETVLLLPLLEQLPIPRSGELPVIIGQTPDGQTITEDLAEFPHLLVAGATNSGKSVFLRSLVLSLMVHHTPAQLQLLIVDPKRTDFSFFNGLPYLMKNKVITDSAEARDMLLDLVHDEMLRRQNLMAERQSTRIKEFNQRFPDEALTPIVALIDEYAQLVSTMRRQERESFESDLMLLASVARATGIHLVLATQRPSTNVIIGTLKANLETRIAFKVASAVDSQIVLDQSGAENLLGHGDMLFRHRKWGLLRVQAPFMGEVEMQNYLMGVKRKLCL